MQHGYISYRLFRSRISINPPPTTLISTLPVQHNLNFQRRTYAKPKSFRPKERFNVRTIPSGGSIRRGDRVEPKRFWNPQSTDDFDELLKAREIDVVINAYEKLGKTLSSGQIQRYLYLIDENLSKHDSAVLLQAVLLVCNNLKRGMKEFDPAVLEKLLYLLRHFKDYNTVKELWKWASTHEDTLTLGVYVAALQVLADPIANEDIDTLENIYNQALASDVGVFTEYHLAHNAVSDHKALADNQKIGALAFGLHPKSIYLLAAIARARLLHGNWKDGYLAFDSACRLSPSRPKLFYEAMLDPGRKRPLSETYRIVRLACREGIKLSPWKIDRVFGDLSHETLKPVRNNNDLLRTIQYVKASVNLLLAELDVGGDILDGHMNKVLVALRHLVRHESTINDPSIPYRSEFSRTIAGCAARLLEKVMPFMKTSAEGPHKILMETAIGARDYELFYGTLRTLFSKGGSASPDLARLLVEAAGLFGKSENVRDAWSELVQAKQDLNSELEPRDFRSLARATIEQADEPAIKFFNEQTRHYGHEHNTYLEDSKSDKRHTAKGDSKPNLDLAGAERIINDVFESAIRSIDQISSKTSDKLILDHNAMGMSIESQPLGTEMDLWKIYDEISVDPAARNSPSYKPISYHDLGLHENSRIRNRFLDWVAVTELMADAQENEAKSNDSESERVVDASNDTRGEIATIEEHEVQPRFSSFDNLRDYIWQIRGISHHLNTQNPQL
jgi:hypothetical protein